MQAQAISTEIHFTHLLDRGMLRAAKDADHAFSVFFVAGGKARLRVTKLTAESGSEDTTDLWCLEGRVGDARVTGVIDTGRKIGWYRPA